MRRFVHASLVAGLLAVAVPAQARKPLLGTVVDGGGKPIVGAAVECVLAPDGPDLPPVDVLTATTDARGRFRVDALPCAFYQCWAAGPADADGTQRVSAVVPAAVGHLPALVAKTRGGAGAVTLRGLDAWQDRAPFTLRCVVAGRAIETKVEATNGEFVASVGARPSGGVEAEVRDRDGCSVFVGELAPRPSRMSVPPPQVVRCRVVDENGQPVAGARVVRVANETGLPIPFFRAVEGIGIGFVEAPAPKPDGRQLGVTGADGVVVVRIAARASALQVDAQRAEDPLYCLRADAPGRTVSYAGRSWHGLFEDGEPAVEQPGRAGFTFTLRPAKPWRGRLVAGDTPLAGVLVTAAFAIEVRSGNGSGHEWHDALRATTDAEGRFRFDGLPPQVDRMQVHHLLGPDAFPARDDASYAARPVFPHAVGSAASRDQEHAIDLGAFATVVVAVRDLASGPGRGLQVALVSAARQTFDFQDLRLLAPDAAGRVAVRLAPGEWCAAACSADGYVVKALDAAATPSLALDLAPFPTLRARIVDADGKPVAGASFSASNTSWNQGDLAPVDWLTQRVASVWNDRLIARRRSGEDGVFQAGFVPAPGWTVQGHFQLRSKRSAPIELVAEDVGDVVVK